MRRRLGGMARELGPTLALAGPVVLAELGWVAMGTVDILIVGRLGAEAIGAVGVGSMLFFSVMVFGMGMLYGLDPLVAQAFGANRLDDCRRSLVQGVVLALLLTPPMMALVLACTPLLRAAGVDPTVVALAVPYVRATSWGLGPLLIFVALRRYLQATARVGPIVFALVSANLVNVLANWVLVFGHLGAPALGVAGSGWATTFSRGTMAATLAVFMLRHDREGPWRSALVFDGARLWRLVALGFPASVQVTLEVGVFAAATTLAGRFGPTSLAAHQLVLNVASVTFMIPLGLSSAAAVRVGQALGRKDPDGASRAGGMAIALGAGFMTAAGITFLVVPDALLSAFTTDPAVIAAGRILLRAAACFQLFDGLQSVATGALRGAGDTRTAMFVNLLAHWGLGLPIGSVLAFRYGLGVTGLWIGLSIGLIAAGLTLLAIWVLRPRAIADLPDPELAGGTVTVG